jgi:hypothetical protein
MKCAIRPQPATCYAGQVVQNVVARRAGRLAFGVVLIAGSLLLATTAFDEEFRISAWQILTATWLLAPAAGFCVALVASRMPASANPDALRGAALAVPAAGLALALPISLMMPFFVAEPPAFDQFCVLALYATGHTHVVLAVLVVVRALQVVAGKRPIRARTIYSACCVVALLPFVVPIAYVATLGALIFPLLGWMDGVAERDRAASYQVPLAIARHTSA